MNSIIGLEIKLREPRWFVDFCDDRIKSITDYCLDENDLDTTNKEMLTIFRENKKEMNQYINGLQIAYFCGVVS